MIVNNKNMSHKYCIFISYKIIYMEHFNYYIISIKFNLKIVNPVV